MIWVRIDNRLVHGQVIETWLPYTKARAIMVVNDDLADDPLRQEIMYLAIPHDVELLFSRVAGAGEALLRAEESLKNTHILVLFATCSDARNAYTHGLSFSQLNVGNLHYSPGKKQICDHVAVGSDDISCLDFFSRRGVTLDFRCVPNKPVQVTTW
ncbi:MAG: PTS sugar transporter subunit IIB [Desulfoplanes sp.]|nr:PTS sugar transporter subunit IIB [Desulfoplanes sp.]MDD4649207.1 PTS sugar transporter subunit IIB [Desulfoplanes sp.]